VAIITGVIAFYATWALNGYFWFYSVAPFDDWKRVIPGWTTLLNYIVPGFIVGAIAPSRSVRNAIASIFVWFLGMTIYLSLHKLPYQHTEFISYFFLSCLYGVVAASCGASASKGLYRFPHYFKMFFIEE